jgi:hypothetical protein
MKTSNLAMSVFVAAGLAAPALGQQLICVGSGGGDISADGQTVLGTIFEYDSGQYNIYTWTRSGGAHRLGVPAQGDGSLRISSDSTVIGHPGYNTENLGGLTYGHAQGWLDNALTRRWTQATGSVNLGVMPGGTSCDYTINTFRAMSRNGQFLVGAGWRGGSGLCGPYKAWIYDSSAHAFTVLPISISPPPASAPSPNTSAWGVSDDGNTVVGYDENYPAGASGSTVRMASVWTKTGTTWSQPFHLDPNGGYAGCVSGNGNVVFGNTSSTGGAVIRWVRNGASWTMTNLGGSGTPLRTNIDGSKVVGEQFYWSNGGVPTDLTSYLTSHGITMNSMTMQNPFGNAVQAMSDDGSKFLFYVLETHGACLGTYQVMLADLTNPTCVPPRINFSPVSQPVTTPTSADYSYGVTSNAFVSGTWPLTYQWQKQTSPGTWINLTDDSCGQNNSANFDVHGSDTSQLRLGFLGAFNTWQGQYRCVVTNACGSATTGVAVIGPQLPTCGSADFNCDGDIGTDADIESFFACLAGTCPASPCTSTADFNGDGDIGTDADIEAFFRVLAGGTC